MKAIKSIKSIKSVNYFSLNIKMTDSIVVKIIIFIIGLCLFIGLGYYIYLKLANSPLGSVIGTLTGGISTATTELAGSKPRGVGVIPNQCPSGQTWNVGLCYDIKSKVAEESGNDKIPSNWEVTAPGFIGKKCSYALPGYTRDDGTTCWIDAKTVGRGVGYPWKGGDALNLDKATTRCEADWGKGNCEQYGAIMYPKCTLPKILPGSSPSGCCTCLLTAKTASKSVKSLIGTIPTGCPSDHPDNQAGLCYVACPTGMKGVGPVCWPNTSTGATGSTGSSDLQTTEIVGPSSSIAEHEPPQIILK